MTELNADASPFPIQRVRRWALIVAAAWIICCIIGWISQPAQFYRCYLDAWLLWLGATLGAMSVVMLHHLTGGYWGLVVRRLGEHAAMVMPLMIVLFIPIILGMHWLYIWDRPAAVAQDPLLQRKQPYLNPGFFLILLAAIYAIIWLYMAWRLRQGSLRLDRDNDPGTTRRLHSLSAGGQVIYFITMSFATVDWIMSREPHWFSTVIGFIVVMGQCFTGLCLLIVLASLLRKTPALRGAMTADRFNDLGNMLLMMVIIWTYMCFAQLLVIWMTNKQEEIPWYVQRLNNGWWWIGLGLVVLHFFVPFIVLLMREAKRKVPIMLGLCVALLVLRAIDMFWMVAPSGEDPTPLLRHAISWMDFVFPIGMGAAWLTMFLWLLAGHPLVIQAIPYPNAEAHDARS